MTENKLHFVIMSHDQFVHHPNTLCVNGVHWYTPSVPSEHSGAEVIVINSPKGDTNYGVRGDNPASIHVQVYDAHQQNINVFRDGSGAGHAFLHCPASVSGWAVRSGEGPGNAVYTQVLAENPQKLASRGAIRLVPSSGIDETGNVIQAMNDLRIEFRDYDAICIDNAVGTEELRFYQPLTEHQIGILEGLFGSFVANAFLWQIPSSKNDMSLIV